MTKDNTARDAAIYESFMRERPSVSTDKAACERIADEYALSAKRIGVIVRKQRGGAGALHTTPPTGNTPFPDKKQPAPVTFWTAIDELRHRQNYSGKTSISQEAATWKPKPQYPSLPVALTWLSDIHFGSLDTDYDLLERHLRTIRTTPNMYIAFGGDEVDNFSPVKIPTGMLGNGLTPTDQFRAFSQLAAELDAEQRLVAWVWGNHNAWTEAAGLDMYALLNTGISCPMFINGGGVLTLKHGRAVYRIGMRHTFWGNSKLNITNAPKRMLQFWRDGLDVAMLAHVHLSAAETFVYAQRQRIAIVGGCYKTGDRFGKQWNGDPHPGGHTVLFHPDTHHMQHCSTPEDAADILLGKIARLPKEREPKVVPFRSDDELDEDEEQAA